MKKGAWTVENIGIIIIALVFALVMFFFIFKGKNVLISLMRSLIP